MVMVVAILAVVVGGGYGLVSSMTAQRAPVAGALTIAVNDMLPTLRPGDVVVPAKVSESGLKRGMIVAFRIPGSGEIRMFRIAGLPGDKIAIQRGIVSINGEESPRRGTGTEKNAAGGDRYLMAEHFPGEDGAHRVAEDGFVPDVAPATVAAGRVYLLADNRDSQTDSRATAQMRQGITRPQTIRIVDIVGRIDTITASADGSRVGQPLDLPASAATQ